MVVYAISGDGIGAGKSSLARLLVGASNVWSLAGQIRADLAMELPGYDWNNRTQSYKDTTRVRERQNKTVRQVMIEHGQFKCATASLHWVELLCDRIVGSTKLASGIKAIAVDDLRKLSELNYLKSRLGEDLVHFHVHNPKATFEPEFENEALAAAAEHIYSWRKP